VVVPTPLLVSHRPALLTVIVTHLVCGDCDQTIPRDRRRARARTVAVVSVVERIAMAAGTALAYVVVAPTAVKERARG
jgi:hypothetical protein